MDGRVNRRLGVGMKPRGTGQTVESEETERPAGSGQTQLSENEESTTCKNAQNVENQNLLDHSEGTVELASGEVTEELGKKPSVAVKDGFQEPAGDFEQLSELMRQSKEEEVVSILASGTIILPTAEDIAAIESGDRLPILGLPEREEVHVGTVSTKLGPQPNGDYGMPVMIRESLVSGVLGQAELEGVTPSEWISTMLNEHLEDWFYGK